MNMKFFKEREFFFNLFKGVIWVSGGFGERVLYGLMGGVGFDVYSGIVRETNWLEGAKVFWGR